MTDPTTPTSTVLYEGLFLMGQSAGADMNSALAHVQQVLDRAQAETLSLHKWDECKLAYPIKGQKRGTYLISLFRARSSQIANIERDCNLSEQIVRAMITRADHLGDVELEQALDQAKTAEAERKLREDQAQQEAAAKEAPPAPEAQAPVAEAVEPEAAPASTE